MHILYIFLTYIFQIYKKDNFSTRYYHNYIFAGRFPLSSIMNSNLVSVYELNFLKLLQKSIFCQIYNPETLKLSFINFGNFFFVLYFLP